MSAWEIALTRRRSFIAEIIVARHAGFCFGVRRAVDTAAAAAPAYTLGPIIHNPQMVAELQRGGVVLSARFHLAADDPEAIAARSRELNARRREKQPLNYPSAGSVFKRPEGHFAGALIEEAGLKGLTIGGAQVSEKHAGFIVNLGGATAADILALIQHVQDEVERRSGVRLEPEVRILGED